MIRLGATVARQPWRIIAAAVAICALSLIPASRFKLRIDLVSLLPDDSSAAAGYREFISRFGGMKTVFVILDSNEHASDVDSFELADAATRLAEILSDSDEVLDARAGLTDDDIAAYLAGIVRRAPLLIPDNDWVDQVESRLAPAAIRRRVQEIRRSLLAPLPAPETQFATHDPLGFASEIVDLEQPGIGQLVDPLTMSFLSQDQRAALVLVEPSAPELEAASGRRLADAIEASARTLRSEIGVEFRVRAVGGPLYAAHDEAVIRSDLVRTLAATLICCGLLITAVFSGVAIPIAALTALAAGLAWTAAVLALTSGGVSAVAIGFSAVLVGLGIDSAIHGGTAFRHYLLAGDHRAAALTKAFHDTGRPIIAASATTAAAFAVLLVSALPLLRELGSMVAVSVGLIVVSIATLGASLALVMAGRMSPTSSWLWRRIGEQVHSVVRFSGQRSGVVLIGTLLISVATIPAAFKTDIQAGLDGLRPTDHPVLDAENALADLFGIHEETTTIIIRAKNLDDAINTTSSIQLELERRFPNLGCTSPADRIDPPSRTKRRLENLEALDVGRAIEVLRIELRASGLNDAEFGSGINALKAFAAGVDPGNRFPTEDHQLRFDSNGEVWAALTVLPPNEGWTVDTILEMRNVVEQVDQSALIASLPLVGFDLKNLASRDLRRLSVLSLLLVIGVVMLSFRGNFRLTFVSLVPVVLGTVWALGCWHIVGRHIDLVGLAVLPVMLGLGIDDGLYAVHGASGSDGQGIRPSLERSGRAMTLTTLTTCIGFGSLGMSHLPSLRAVAVLIPLGVCACLLATLMVLPALADRGWGLK